MWRMDDNIWRKLTAIINLETRFRVQFLYSFQPSIHMLKGNSLLNQTNEINMNKRFVEQKNQVVFNLGQCAFVGSSMRHKILAELGCCVQVLTCYQFIMQTMKKKRFINIPITASNGLIATNADWSL